MRAPSFLLILSALLAALPGAGEALVAQEATGGLEARVWLDRGGEEPVLRRGEDVRIYYRTNADAFAAIFRIDTDGRVALLYPQHPGAVAVVRGGRDYRLLPPQGAEWRVDEDPGMGYYFIVASAEPLDFSLFPFDERYGWDLRAVGEEVYTDPYVAIDDYVAAIVPGWETVPYALDFLSYSVGDTYSYPRFLCYDCHTHQRFASWNPYDYNCVTYRVVIWDDPFFYPRYRYSGVNVVYAWPVRALPRYEVTRRVVGDAVAPIVRVRTPAQREAAYREVSYKESPVATTPRNAAPARRVAAAPMSVAPSGASVPGVRSSAEPMRRSSVTSANEGRLASPQERARGGAAPQQVPDTARSRPTLQRRPSARLPVRTPPSARQTPPAASEPKDVTPAPTRTAPRAPITRPQRVPPSTPSSRSAPEREPQATPAPSRPSARSSPSRTPPQTSTGVRPQTTPRASAPSAGSGSSRPTTSRPSASPTPARPRETPSARPSPAPRASEPRQAEPRSSPPRSSEPRPTVRSRPAEPPSRN